LNVRIRALPGHPFEEHPGREIHWRAGDRFPVRPAGGASEI